MKCFFSRIINLSKNQERKAKVWNKLHLINYTMLHQIEHLRIPIKSTETIKLILNRSSQSSYNNSFLCTNANFNVHIEEQLKEIFKLKNSNISTWIVEVNIS